MDSKELDKLTQDYLLMLRTQEHLEDFKNFLEEARKSLYLEWKSQSRDWNEIRAELAVLDRLEGIVNRVISDGKIAKERLDKREDL